MDQITNNVAPSLQIESVLSTIRSDLDNLLSKYNLSPRHILSSPLKDGGYSLSFSSSLGGGYSEVSAAQHGSGSVIFRLRAQKGHVLLEVPCNRTCYYKQVSFSAIPDYASNWAGYMVDRFSDLPIFSSSVCSDVEDQLLHFPSDFGCCHLFEQCSDAGHCINADQDFAASCYYKRNLMSGKIFYGKNSVLTEKSTPVIAVKASRPGKGTSLVCFPSDFVVFDLETTGLSPSFDEIIEFAGLRVRGEKVVERFSTLIKPNYPVSDFITDLTGITNEMLDGAPSIESVIAEIKDFIASDILVGHNVNFDINFLYDAIAQFQSEPLSNDFVDTMRLSRKVLPDLQHHRLSDIAAALGVSHENAHRALCDCTATFDCYYALKQRVLEKMTEEEFCSSFKRRRVKYDYNNLKNISTEKGDFDETHPLYHKYCVFTGTLEKMTRAEAAQLVVDLGGYCENTITKKTNFLVLGNNDYNPLVRGGKSNKQKKAEAYILAGQDIEIVPESVFYDLVGE